MRIDLEDTDNMRTVAAFIEEHLKALSGIKRLLYLRKVRDAMEGDFKRFVKNPSAQNWNNLNATKFAFQQTKQIIQKLKRRS